MDKINIQFYKTKIGELTLGSFEDKLLWSMQVTLTSTRNSCV